MLPCAWAASALAQPAAGARVATTRWAVPDTLVDGAALQADIGLLARAEEALHPGLYRYQSATAWRARVAALRRDVAGGMGQRAFYARLAELTAAIRCGHSYPNFFNQSAAVRGRVLEAGPRLPFLFRWAGDTMVVTRDLSPHSTPGTPAASHASGATALRPGTRVLALDDVPAARVLARLLPLARADGANDDKRREILSVTGGETYEAFDVYYPLRFALGDSVTLDVRAPGVSRAMRHRMATLTHAEREAARAPLGARPAAPLAPIAADTNPLGWTLALRPDSTAVLTMPSWATYGHARWDWQGWLARALDLVQAAGAPRLVLDLRENEGGSDDVQRALLAALARRPVTLVGDAQYVRYRTLPPALRPYADTWDRAFDDWSAALADGTGRASVRGPGGVTLHRLRPGAMGGDTTVIAPGTRGPAALRVAVLVGPVNSSSTFAFAQAARRSGLARLVGAPTGGNLRGINGGAFYFFRLPNSGIEVDIPLVGYFPSDVGPGPALARVPDAGLAPDVRMARTPDVLAGEADGPSDVTLAAAVAMLRR